MAFSRPPTAVKLCADTMMKALKLQNDKWHHVVGTVTKPNFIEYLRNLKTDDDLIKKVGPWATDDTSEISKLKS